MKSMTHMLPATAELSAPKVDLRRWPVASLGLAALAVLLYFLPGAGGALELERGALARGELWRLLTGHWAHFSAEHLFWDVAVFAVLGALCELEGRGRYLACVFGSACAISLAVWAWLPELPTYRGLSGIDSALFVMLAALLLAEKWREREWLWVLAAGLALAGFLGKTAFEAITGGTLFVQNTAMRPVPLAHLIGAAVGLAISVSANLAPDKFLGDRARAAEYIAG